MKAAALICEFNPFHNGHKYIIDRIKQTYPERAVLCFMSGEYVQRGEYALLCAHDRAKAAVLCGADAVFAIPSAYTLSPAQRYASCSVKLIRCFAGADVLCFGSESGDANALETAAKRLSKLEFANDNRTPYPIKRAAAYYEKYGEKLPVSPNDMLALEYIAALADTGIEYKVFPRIGGENMISASKIRELLQSGASISEYMPEAAYYVLCDAVKNGRIRDNKLSERSLISALLDADKRTPCADVPADFTKRIASCANESTTLCEYYEKLSVKQYTAARLRRMTLCTALGIGAAEWDGLPPYVTLLAANKKGREYLANKPCTLPILTKPAAVKELGAEAEEYFERENMRSRLAFSSQEKMPSFADAYRQSPFVTE